MRAILPGRPQSTRQAVCTAQWDGLRLVAYVSGNTVVILRSPKEIVQIISIDHVRSLTAVLLEESSGRLALCDESRVLIFGARGKDEDDLRWVQTHDIVVPEDGVIRSLSWGTSEELLVGGTQLWLYNLPYSDDARLIWQQHLANEVHIASFSNDAELIATCGRHDRLVKIWRRLSFELDSTRFDVAYLPHPAAVTNIHWRKPWHAEQNLDNLLYTFCSDSQIRVWSYTDPHSLSVVQLIATIDTSTSIEPRRRSVGSVSQKRYAFILDSRDFSQATEKAIQQSQNRQVDHALEHLIEIANQSPELCVVLDGLGHMSVWGLENAGCKTKKPAAVFNIALVDDVGIQLDFSHSKDNDYIQFCTFEGESPATLSLLVHSYAGQVDWYESPIAQFFDTSSRRDRVRLMSSWSGHNLAIDHISCGHRGNELLSWADEGQAILWSQSETGALRRQCEIDVGQKMTGVVLLDPEAHLIVLHSTSISLWDLRQPYGRKVYTSVLESKVPPASIQPIAPATSSKDIQFLVAYEDATVEIWKVRLASIAKKSSRSNGIHNSFTKLARLNSRLATNTRMIECDYLSQSHNISLQNAQTEVTFVDEGGKIQSYGSPSELDMEQDSWQPTDSLETNIKRTRLARANSMGKLAIATKDGKSVYIWDLTLKIYEWKYKFEGTDRIQKLSWTSTPHGNLQLFIASSYQAVVVGQFGFASTSNQYSAWCVMQEISLREFTTISIGDACWAPSQDIAVAAGNQIFVLESVMTRSEPALLQYNRNIARSDSTSAVTDMGNSALPVFHADFLDALLADGDELLTATILKRLYEKLKYFAEGDELASNLDIPAIEFMLSPSETIPNDQVYVNGDMSTELEVVEDSFKEYLSNAEIWQLDSQERQRVCAFYTNYVLLTRHVKSLDKNGLRYLQSLYSTPHDEDLPWDAFVFASRSDSHETLIDLVSRRHDGKITWQVARRTGMFIWLSDKIALQTQFENIARAEYTKHEDRNPVDCSLHYLALNKKAVLQGLWRMTIGVKEKENTMKLLANNFDDPKWKATASKNAYALLSKHRFEYAAAFFLLAGSLKDAVNVCVRQLHDIQLAIAITRVWDKDVEQSEQVLEELLHQHVLPIAVDNEQGRWISAWAYTILEQPVKALQAVVRPLHQVTDIDLSRYPNGPVKSMCYQAIHPSFTLLYTQIRETLIKQNRWTPNVLTQREEHDFATRSAKWWIRARMDVLAYRLLVNWKFVPHQESRSTSAVTTMTRILSTEPETNASVEEIGQDKDKVEAGVKEDEKTEKSQVKKAKPPPTQFVEPSADSLLDSFGF